jgi:type IV pilus assembly protein PilB
MAKVKSFGERIADALVEDGLLSAKQVEELLEQQKKEGTRLIKLVVEKPTSASRTWPFAWAACSTRPPVNLARINIPPEMAELVPRDMAHNYKVVPVSRLENKLFLAMADPLERPRHGRRQAHHQAGNRPADRLRKGHH